MKKMCIIFFIFALFSIIFISCNSKNKDFNSISEFKIGVFFYTKDDTFISTLQSNIEKFARSKEIEKNIKMPIEFFDAKGSQTVQNEQIYKCIEQDYSILCINIVDRTVAAPIIERAKMYDIPIIFFNREPVKEDMEMWDKVYYVGADAKISGIIQGDIVIDIYNNDKDNIDKNNDAKIQYIVLEGEQGHKDSILRTEYSIKTITNSGIVLDKLGSETANWQRSQAMSKTLQFMKVFGNEIELILSNNDDMALGAIDAYVSENINNLPIIVGVDCIEPAIEELRSGRLKGTVFGDFKGQAKSIIDLSYALALNENPSKYLNLKDNKYIMHKYVPVTMENLYKLDLY